MNQSIYILEDEPEMTHIMQRALEQHGYKTQGYRLCGEFERALQNVTPDLCLIDLSLPDGDGLTIITESLRRRGIPAIVVTGRGDSTERIVGLELGADDYMVKPFEPREMVARVRAVLRRSQSPKVAALRSSSKIAKFNGWTVDFSSCTLSDPDGNADNLSTAEAALLEAFVSASGRVLSRPKLLDIGNPDDLDPYDRSIDARISRLRRKLGDDPKSPRMIRTVYGSGYVFVAEVEWENG